VRNVQSQSVRPVLPSHLYHLERVTIVTDGFHAPRAIYLCRHFGMDAVALSCRKEAVNRWYWVYHAREYLARVKAVWDVTFKAE
jgi:SanA protein